MQRFSIPAMVLLALVACFPQTRTACALTDDNYCIDEKSSEESREEAAANPDAAITSVWSSKVKAGFGLLKRIDEGVIKQFEKAWIISNSGTSGREGLILIFRMADGSYRGKSMNQTGEYKKLTFTWEPSAVAIVHTHPNGDDPKPSKQDQLVAEKLDVPIFTITRHGMYGYDPYTKITAQVLDDLDWLDPSKWTQDVYRKLVATLFDERNHRPIHHATVIRSTHKSDVDMPGSR